MTIIHLGLELEELHPEASSKWIRAIMLCHYGEDDFYAFPGGGVEAGERFVDALVREVLEETGYDVVRSTVHPYGYAKMVKADNNKNAIFTGVAYYFFCDINRGNRHETQMTGSEKRRKMECVLIPITDLRKIVKHNLEVMKKMKDRIDSGDTLAEGGFPRVRRYDFIYRDTKVLDALPKTFGV